MLTLLRFSVPELVPELRPLRRPAGFLDANRRLLAIGAIAATGLLTSVPSLPAKADAFQGPAAAIPVQSYVAPAVIPLPMSRDAFSITAYSVVQWPVPSSTPISSGFGLRECDGCATDHKGTDFNPGAGYPIQAIADGVVTEAGWDATGYGFKVVIQHVIDGQTTSSLYAHVQEGSIAVQPGATVARGQQLGLVGDTGESTGAHLHFSIIVNDVMIDPFTWMLAHANA